MNITEQSVQKILKSTREDRQKPFHKITPFLLGIGEFLPITIRLLSFIVYEKGEKLGQFADNQRLINVVIHLLEFLAEDDNGDQHHRNLC